MLFVSFSLSVVLLLLLLFVHGFGHVLFVSSDAMASAQAGGLATVPGAVHFNLDVPLCDVRRLLWLPVSQVTVTVVVLYIVSNVSKYRTFDTPKVPICRIIELSIYRKCRYIEISNFPGKIL